MRFYNLILKKNYSERRRGGWWGGEGDGLVSGVLWVPVFFMLIG